MQALAGVDGVIARAAIDAVVAAATLDGVVAVARLDDEVDLHRRIDLDVVVAVAGAHGELLAPRQRHVVLLAVDVEAQLAVLALGALDLVVAVAGLEYELFVKNRVLAGARVGFGGCLAGDLALAGAAPTRTSA